MFSLQEFSGEGEKRIYRRCTQRPGRAKTWDSSLKASGGVGGGKNADEEKKISEKGKPRKAGLPASLPYGNVKVAMGL